MKSTLLLLIVLMVVLFLGARQQAELTELRQEHYEQYLQAGDYYQTIIEQQADLAYAERLAKQAAVADRPPRRPTGRPGTDRNKAGADERVLIRRVVVGISK